MAPIAIIFGILLTLLGPILYFTSESAQPSPTAFIPTGFGIALIICGIFARNERLRMHAMHGAALVGLVGIVAPLARLFYAISQPNFQFGRAALGSLTMAGLCAVFVALCVKSFIDARAARKKREAEAVPPA